MDVAGLKICRFIALIVSAILCLVAIILLTIGLATPSWLIVQYRLSNGMIEEHRHGIWLDCMLRGSNHYSMENTYFPSYGSAGDQCEYKWVNVEYPYYGGGGMNGGMINPYYGEMGGVGAMSTMFENDFAQHRFLGWHVTILVMVLIAITAGIFSLFCSCCVIMTGLCSPIVALLEFVAFLCSAIGCVVFFVNANRPEIRYVQIPNSAERWRINEGPNFSEGPNWFLPHFPSTTYGRPGIWGGDGGFGTIVGPLGNGWPPSSLPADRLREQVRGFSFDLSVAAVFIFLLSFLVGILSTVIVFMHAHRDHQRRHLASKTYPKTDITTVSSPINDSNGNFARTHSPRSRSPAIDV